MIDRGGVGFSYSRVIAVAFGWPAIYRYSLGDNQYSYGSAGNIKVTKLDTDKRLISGSFSFSYINDGTGKTEKVENGIFRNIHY